MNTYKGVTVVLMIGVVLGGAFPTRAALSDFLTSDNITYNGGVSNIDQVIPDNTAAGVGYSVNFGATGLSISDISITMYMMGGYNGDLYAYLSHGNTLVQLLNPNPAVSSSGMNITLAEGTGNYIPSGGSGLLSGTYTAYSNLNAFNNTDPHGGWTIFFADLSPGDTSTLNGVSIGITTVPEPSTGQTLAVFGGLVLLWHLLRSKSISPNIS